MAHPQHRKRQTGIHRLLRWSLIALVLAVVVTVVLRSVPRNSVPPSTSTSLPRAANTSTSQAPTSTTLSRQAQLKTGVNSVLDNREGTIEVAVENVGTDATLTFGPQEPQDEASVVKVNILAALLSASISSPALSVTNQSLAQEMIEKSDNNAATDLWDAAGGSAGIGMFDHQIGLSSTKLSPCVQCAGFPWPGWGLTTTTPLDEIKLLKAVFLNPDVLTSEDRAFQLRLMEAVIPSERWGVTNGVAGTATVALKNGWLPLDASSNDWQINSVGWIRGDGRNYLIAMFSTDNPSEDYGIQSLDEISTVVWDHMAE